MILHSSYDVNEAGHLTIGGIDAADLAAEFGTPAYFLDTDAVRTMCRTYKKAFADYFGENPAPFTLARHSATAASTESSRKKV